MVGIRNNAEKGKSIDTLKEKKDGKMANLELGKNMFESGGRCDGGGLRHC
jgi:hypothetical protein